MMANPTLLILVFAGFFALMLLTFSVGWKIVEAHRKKKVVGMLDTVAGKAAITESTILKDPAEQRKSVIDSLLEKLDLTKTLQAQIHQAGLDWTPGKLAAMMLAAALVGAVAGLKLKIALVTWASMLLLAALFGLLPYLLVLRKRSKRLAAFEAQFPDALDFLARAMRAGHAFSVSLELLSEEAPEPLAREFRQVYNEQNLGAPIEQALKNLADRVPLVDVGFFVSAVTLQKETGGNLSEILNKLAYVIRERFKLKGQVRAVSAHGRITGLILTLMPVGTALALMAVAPSYLRGLAEDPIGKWLILAAIAAQFLGYIIMKQIINIKV
ncbi:MAG: type II secretion system F family protein [Bryobacteraceae bacterium]